MHNHLCAFGQSFQQLRFKRSTLPCLDAAFAREAILDDEDMPASAAPEECAQGNFQSILRFPQHDARFDAVAGAGCKEADKDGAAPAASHWGTPHSLSELAHFIAKILVRKSDKSLKSVAALRGIAVALLSGGKQKTISCSRAVERKPMTEIQKE